MELTRRLAIGLAATLLGTVAGLLASAPSPAADVARPAARVFSVEDAMKELDLIRPSRQKVAQDFTLPLREGRPFKLSESRGKLVLINFWATWCAPCLEEMPAMERLWQQHKARGFLIVAISVDSDPAAVTPFVAKGRFTFPIALDPKLETANLYGVRALPSSFLVDRKGHMAALALGPRAWDGDAAHALIEGLAR